MISDTHHGAWWTTETVSALLAQRFSRRQHSFFRVIIKRRPDREIAKGAPRTIRFMFGRPNSISGTEERDEVTDARRIQRACARAGNRMPTGRRLRRMLARITCEVRAAAGPRAVVQRTSGRQAERRDQPITTTTCPAFDPAPDSRSRRRRRATPTACAAGSCCSEPGEVVSSRFRVSALSVSVTTARPGRSPGVSSADRLCGPWRLAESRLRADGRLLEPRRCGDVFGCVRTAAWVPRHHPAYASRDE